MTCKGRGAHCSPCLGFDLTSPHCPSPIVDSSVAKDGMQRCSDLGACFSRCFTCIRCDTVQHILSAGCLSTRLSTQAVKDGYGRIQVQAATTVTDGKSCGCRVPGTDLSVKPGDNSLVHWSTLADWAATRKETGSPAGFARPQKWKEGLRMLHLAQRERRCMKEEPPPYPCDS